MITVFLYRTFSIVNLPKEKSVAIINLIVIPIGTETPSISKYDIQNK
ncbi:hypothetical protein [Metabacillus arenae]|uniref:Uncharacterized protein n=1 Tax=Metabacillus arenae TaxID=2771434 RepID=A0A926S2B0_9BACI|nr:hypothetical protein [Metabacillus arenae]MBD1381829.1 hypothetical protein [Metabacillus arenae]